MKNAMNNDEISAKALYVIKIGGAIIDNELKLTSFLEDFAAIRGKKILVHGGGKIADTIAEKLGVPQQMIEGRRITNAETLKIITMVYGGYINKNIVAQLQSSGCNAIGLSGADANSLLAKKRKHPSIDYGFAGDVENSLFNIKAWQLFLENNLVPVVCPITHDGKGQLLNTNADTIAQEIAKGLSASYAVNLIYTFEKSGVLLNMNDDNSVIKKINAESYQGLKDKQQIFAGMIPKLDNAFTALSTGVKKVVIGNAEKLNSLVAGTSGTSIVNE
jgi:acetylglutamate kinase